ncbi:hypothetical protein C9926_00195 [Sulfurovum lithotrophicum]|nr:hypothetical protein C9926_00195 [Sulfurovum lithotrophicum]
MIFVRLLEVILFSATVGFVIFIIGLFLATGYIMTVDAAFYMGVFSGISLFIVLVSILIYDSKKE